MVARPLQIEHWMERGYTRWQAEVLYADAVEYTVQTIGKHVYRYHERMDEYWFNVPPNRTENDIGEELIETGYYRYVCPNWRTYPSGGVRTTTWLNEYPDDPLLDNQWHLKRIEAPAGWQIHHEGHDDVVLGVSDTGMYVDHDDLSDLNEFRRVGWDQNLELWESNGGVIHEEGGSYCHGTVVLGIAAATGNNDTGVSGIGWSLRHRMLQFGNGHTDDALNTIWVSAEAGDRVICSTTGDDFADPDVWTLWADNTEYVREGYPQLLIVHIAGNDPDFVYPPFPDMIMVGGTDPSDAVWWTNEDYGSSVGAHVDVMAPAVQVYSTKCASASTYGNSFGSGTSYATPQVAGLCALIWSYDPELSASEVQALLYAGCDEHVGYDPDLHGHGRINVFNSLALASGELWTRDPHPGLADEDNIFKAAGATDEASVRFYYGTATGQTQVSGCTAGTYVGIASASIFGTATATSNGAAILDEVFVPSGWAETTVYIQAVDLSDCRVSNLIVYTFPPLN